MSEPSLSNHKRGWCMIKKNVSGLSLIEMIVFILIVGIVATGTLMTANTVLTYQASPNQILQAAQLARARMAIILQTRRQEGFNNTADVCASGSPPAACTELATFATTYGFTVNSTIGGATEHQLITVSVSGNAIYDLVARVSNYEVE